MDYILKIFSQLLSGLGVSCALIVITLIASLPLGLMISFLRVRKKGVLKAISGIYVWILRGTPLLLQLFFFYFGFPFIPVIGKYLAMPRFTAACVAFALNYAAYFAEIFRGGIISIDAGQYDAARVLGFTKLQTTIKITIPQMLRVSLPALTNEMITLVKDTALVTAIGIAEILHFAKNAVNRDVNVTAYIAAAILYLLMTTVVAQVLRHLEKKFSF